VVVASLGSTLASGFAQAVVPVLPQRTIALGVAVDDPTYPTTGNVFQHYVATVGRQPAFVEYYQDPWSSTVPVVAPGEPIMFGPTNALTRANDLTPVISWGTNGIPLRDVIAGHYDAYLDASAQEVKAYGSRVYIRLDWEMNGTWSGWNPAQQPAGTTPATFVAFWRHVVARFRTDGATNVRWIWSPNVDDGHRSMAPFYPGSDVVDMVGLDGYNKGDLSWAGFGQIFQPSYHEVTAVAPGKPVMIAETASLEATPTEAGQGASKAKWIRQLARYLTQRMPAVSALCWFEQPVGTSDFRVESSSASLGAWKRYVADRPAFQGTLP
jgi:hypothetical protein